ncbi:MAG: RNA polymerase sigma factor [Verrucomicrobiae bacterium]|nr:RNA polymerase sigma factor [Verrucomicrobiae bacterium]
MPAGPDLERLYDEHGQSIFAFLLNLTRNEEDTRDLLQDVFVKLARNPGLFDGVHDARAFLLRLAHNAAIDLMRRCASRQHKHEQLAAETIALFAPASAADEETFRRAMAEALGELPPEQRAAPAGAGQAMCAPHFNKEDQSSMNTDNFEQHVHRQPLRRVPTRWREEILSAARARQRTAAAQTVGVALAAVLVDWRAILARLPLAWMSLAAIWIVMLSLNALLSGPGLKASGAVLTRMPAEPFALWTQQTAELGFLTGELGNSGIVWPPPDKPHDQPRPRSELRSGTNSGETTRGEKTSSWPSHFHHNDTA